MAQSNPLLRRSKLPPISGQATTGDIQDRLKTMQNPAALLLSYAKLNGQNITLNRPRQTKTSAPVHIAISQDDQLPTDFVEGKEPYENIAFAPLNQDPEGIYTFVENLKTGNFRRFFNNNLVIKEAKPVYTSVSEEEKEASVYMKLEDLSFFIHRFFLFLQGICGGLGIVHIYLLLSNFDDIEFLDFYAQHAVPIGTLFHIVVFLSLVGAIHRVISEKNHYTVISRTEVDYDTSKHRMPYYIAMVCTICYAIAYIFVTACAAFASRMYFNDKNYQHAWKSNVDSSISDGLKSWRWLMIIADALIILAWIIWSMQSNWNIGTLYRMELEALKRKEEATVVSYLQKIYRHLFYGNPYLPSGVYTINDTKEESPTKEKAEKEIKKL
ncbi:unnamed protein product [Blepharisma stoltei]|uniref:Gustatory receptor n=1 Tax=Blepharisma stoltei TaxID=1481888 RepID=A0AAU9KC65_9CILI|nr:unnamed protein product [Blepharisma stoltei]